jgi:hypothetical protein
MATDRLRELSNQSDNLEDIQAAILYLKNARNHPDMVQRLTTAEQLISKLTTKVNKLAAAATAAAEATSIAAAAASAAAVAATLAAAEAKAIAAAITIAED